MRKNTLIKLLAVLAMCFILGAALVACGNNEEPETETAKVVSSVAFDSEGNLVITYDDNSTQKVALPVAKACEHKSIAKHTLTEHTATANGSYLEVCDDCGYAWIKYEQRHNWIENPITVEPTCKSEGYTTEKYCDICGVPSEKTDVVPAIDHKWDEGYLATSGNICEEGGTYVYECVYGCGTTDSKTVAAAPVEGIDGAHTVADWTVVTDPTVDTTGLVTGTCTVCDEAVEYVLPALKKDGAVNTTDYTVANDPRTSCREAATADFTLKANTDIIINNAVVEEAGVSHMLKNSKGELVFVHEAELDENGKPVYSYSTAEYAGIKGFADKPVQSCTPILAYYYCEAEYCDAIIDVYAYSEHNFVEISEKSVAPDCENDGFIYSECKDCGESKKDIVKALGHNKVYTDLVNESGDAYNKFSYVESCTRCDYEKKIELDADDVTVDKTSNPVSCEKDGSVKVTYTIPAYNGVEAQTKTVEYTIKKLGHYLNGQHIQAVIDNRLAAPTEGDIVYNWYEDCGIEAFEGKPITADAPVIAYFVCDHKSADGVDHKVDVWVMIGGDVDIVPVED